MSQAERTEIISYSVFTTETAGILACQRINWWVQFVILLVPKFAILVSHTPGNLNV